ncbi:histidine phosphatase family protein [Aurantimonas sp. VKM B-3413]|uniref:histidine phosphatase family protein n=1 Tax=Aurantimonas sp. VKM B-3413 TaxID=2779401 RepID=UPI001E4900D7|nr:histidine phosphatase family protein [Aurantimonas sp. VKM B-3413]MCB8838931.1 histidine phosphatase family protein [Aurantimonas sp. VKM B-3413]
MALPPLFLCRHGQTSWNAEGRLQGQEDVPLSPLGRHQARRNGRYLREVLRDRVADFRFLSSPLSRARDTMQIIRRELGLVPEDFETDDRLIELNFGVWQGQTTREIRQWDAAGLAARDADKWHFVPPGERAESYAILAERARPVFEELTGPTIITAHGGISRIFLAEYCDVPGDEAAYLGIPQDRVLTLEHGQPQWR